MGEEPQEHDDCPRNYKTGSSKAMEATAALDLVVELAAMGVGVEFIVSDDDSTMRAHLKHIGTHTGGKLPLDVPQPTFLCDPSHRVKVMVKEIFKLALASKKQSECEKIDALRLKKYVGCYIAKNKLLPFENFKAKAKAPIEHLFACHEWCDHEWCYSKELDMAREQLTQVTVQTATTEATIAGGGEVVSPTTTEVISPTESEIHSDSGSSPTATIVGTIAGGDEVVNPTTTEVTNPADSFDSSDSLPYVNSFSTICSEEDIEVYTLEYEKEDEDLFFFKNLCTEETEDGIEAMIFSTTDLDALKEKEKNLRAKEDSKYFRNKEIDSKL